MTKLRLIHTDLKAFLETNSGYNAYPTFIPSDKPVPAISYRLEGIVRSEDSDLDSTTATDHTFSVFVISKNFNECFSTTQSLINSLEGKGFVMGGTKVLVSHVLDVSDDFDHEQSHYIQVITVFLKVDEK